MGKRRQFHTVVIKLFISYPTKENIGTVSMRKLKKESNREKMSLSRKSYN